MTDTIDELEGESPPEDDMQKVNRAVLGIFDVLKLQHKRIERQDAMIEKLTETLEHLTRHLQMHEK